MRAGQGFDTNVIQNQFELIYVWFIATYDNGSFNLYYMLNQKSVSRIL